jgi:hypothetical protein
VLWFAEEEERGGALTLRASFPPIPLVVRRLVATAMAIATIAFFLLQTYHATDCFAWVGLPFGGAVVALMILALPREEIAELHVAADGTVHVRERGRFSWLRGERVLRAPLRFTAGLAPDRHVPEHGLALAAAEGEAIYFTVAGIDRRDEARKLAHLLATRLRCGIAVVQDDVFRFVADLGADLPPPITDARGGAYRAAPSVAASIDTTRRPSFEAPETMPPRFVLGASSELRDTVSVFDPDDGRFGATMAKGDPILTPENRRAARRWALIITTSTLGCGIAGAAIGSAVGDALGGAGIGVTAGVVMPLGVLLAGTATGVAVAGMQGILWLAWNTARGPERIAPNAHLAAKPREWFLDARAGALELHGRAFSRRWRAKNATVVAIVADESGRELALYLKVGWRWARLLRSRWLPSHDRPMIERAPALASIATEIARALDVPIRYVG